jgi:predicted DNA-binding transcriptional regulator AlpA
LSSDEVDQISLLHPLTRVRLEKRGLFPKRVRIGARKMVWRRADVEQWAADPEGWASRRNRAESMDNVESGGAA